jgi:hypothetical protein
MRHNQSATAWLVAASILLLTGCGQTPDHSTERAIPSTQRELPTGSLRIVSRVDLTPGGNRVVTGAGGRLGSVDPVVVDLDGRPEWILPDGEGRWLVALADGVVVRAGLDGEVEAAGEVSIDEAPLAVEAVDGSVVLVGPDRYPSVDSFADRLPDTRVVYGAGLAAALVQPTERYGHGVLGDRVEAGAVQVVRDGVPGSPFGLAAPNVIEAISPMLADVDGDGGPEVVVTESNGDDGAALAVWSLDGEPLARSNAIGRGNRWRNLLAVAPVGPGGEIEVVDVRTPHIGGTVEWFRLDGDRLVRVATKAGYTSHVNGSRNLDLGIVADGDGDGRLDVIVPTDSRSELGLLTRTSDGVEIAAQVPLPGRLATNIGAWADPGGHLTIAVGTTDNMLLIWPGHDG